ncbi:hypothetical protein HRbin17_02297 [bacterium HR17]|jgi:cell division protein FtsB|uniref:Uncharacterized protein n=1 Tax=Candidatus Fervidibacter japonicus TaxID=2035412 RepID=A0A2H5XF04_9BACT|nr:hypothetical protein HRbin17_02297 [bacterium HR17]
MRWVIGALLTAVLLWVGWALGQSGGDSDPTKALEKRIAELEKRVADLEKRCQTLEQQVNELRQRAQSRPSVSVMPRVFVIPSPRPFVEPWALPFRVPPEEFGKPRPAPYRFVQPYYFPLEREP